MNVKVDGVVLETFGFTDSKVVDGVGLLTHGLVITCNGDWVQPDSVTTNWSQGASVMTNWGPNNNPIFGDDC